MATRSDPSRYTMATTEVIQFTWDVSPMLEDGETSSLPTITLTQVVPSPEAAAPAAALSGSPSTISTNIYAQIIDATELESDYVYRVDVTFDTSGGDTKTMQTFIYVGNAQPYTGSENTLRSIRQDLGSMLGDMRLVSATATGTADYIIDTNNVNKPSGEFKGSYIRFYSGTTANIGMTRVITGSEAGTGKLSWSVALPAATAIYDKAEVWNHRGTGWSPAEIDMFIRTAHREASYYNNVPRIDTVASAFDANTRYVTIGSAIKEVNSVEYLSSSGEWVEIPKARAKSANGYWIDYANRRIYITGQMRVAVDTLVIRILGKGREDELESDSDATNINPEWIRARAAHFACMALLTKTPDSSILRDKANAYRGEADQKRALIIPQDSHNADLLY